MKARLSGASGRSGLAIPTIILGAIVVILSLSVLVYREIIAPPEGGAAGLAVVTVALAILLLVRRARPAQPTSADVSSRLLQVESRLSALDRPPTGIPQDLADISADVGLLSGLVKSLAEALTAQDREIAELKSQIERLSASAAERPAPLRTALETAGERPGVVPAPIPPPVPAPPSLPAMLDRPVRPPRSAEPAPAGPALPNRVVPSLLPAAENATGSPARARFESDSSAFEAKRAAIMEALDREQIELHLQPIVSLPQRRTRLYEVLARLRLADDTLLSPAEFMPTLERLGRLARMDEIVVARALAIATHVAARDSDVRISCNLTPASLRDPVLLGKLEAMLALPGILASRLVFEIQQRSWRTLSSETLASMDRLRTLGVSFGLDRATDLRFDGIALGEKGVTLVKIPADMLLGPTRSGERSNIAAELTASLARQGVQVVAERIEREADVPDLLDLDIPLAQGFALGAPRAVRADFAMPRNASPAPVAATPAPAPLAPASPAKPGEDRVPFRAFLRRTG
jgi:cyclic-di-GMP phosphodiesterase TipF (flagellum assembly factor)